MGEGSNYDEYLIFDPQPLQVTGKYRRLFIQPALCLDRGVVQLSFVTRFSFVDVYSFQNNFNSAIVSSEDVDVFFEPAVICRVNLLNDRLNFTTQLGSAVTTSSDVYYDYAPASLGIGLGFRLGSCKNIGD